MATLEVMSFQLQASDTIVRYFIICHYVHVAASNFSPDSTGSTLRVSPDSMVNNKGSLDLSHSKVDVDKAAPSKMVSNGPVIDKEKKTESFSSLPSNLPESLRWDSLMLFLNLTSFYL